jgi:methylmalonyl-CoA/ethylmalonyl-CoA epimerase
MVRKIHHINFIVRDLERAIRAYEQILGTPVTRRDELVQRGVKAARFRVGETWLVLVQPTRADSVPGRYLAEHGEGFFLMSLEVGTLADAIRELGPAMTEGAARAGAEHWRVQDLRRDLTFGAQLQLCEDPGDDSASA